jgi:hypothetical protein
MAKIIFYLSFLCLFIQSCNNKEKTYSYNSFIKDGYNMIISGSGVSIDFNLKQGKIKINYHDSKWNQTDSIKLSELEKNYLSNLLFESDMLRPRGESYFAGEFMTNPSNDDKIIILKDNKTISTFYINRNFKSRDFFPSREETKIIEFRDKSIDILRKNKDYILMEVKRKQLLSKEKTLFL